MFRYQKNRFQIYLEHIFKVYLNHIICKAVIVSGIYLHCILGGDGEISKIYI